MREHSGSLGTEKAAVVYLLDCDPEVSKSIQFLLRAEKIEAQVFDDERSLLAHARVIPPSCIVVDNINKGTDGKSIIDHLHDIPLFIPLIVLSCSSSVATAVSAVKAGAWDYFEKPFVQRELLDSVHRAVRDCGHK
ncbi:MAG: response regulator transcription factor [Spongiibacteraceae bacterium]